MIKSAQTLLIYSAIVAVLLLASLNIQNYLNQKKVLGAKTNIQDSNIDKQFFWETFLSKNPNYIVGWIETGRLDRAEKINPNFSLLYHP